MKINLTDADQYLEVMANHALFVRTNGQEGKRANLRGANLREADLSGTNLSGTDLSGTDLQGLPTPWEWAKTQDYPVRAIQGRTLICGKRSRTSQHVGSTTYAEGHVYIAPHFSTCSVTSCHPGLYVANAKHDIGPNPIHVAYWMDEAIVAGDPTDYKCRVRRFYVLRDKEAFDSLTAKTMEGVPHEDQPK